MPTKIPMPQSGKFRAIARTNTISNAIRIEAFSKMIKIGFVPSFTRSFMRNTSINPAISCTLVEEQTCSCSFVHNHHEQVKQDNEHHRVAAFLGSKRVCVFIEKRFIEVVTSVKMNLLLLSFRLENDEHGCCDDHRKRRSNEET